MSFIEMSSSLLAPSISTLGRMAIGGTAMVVTTKCSGRPTMSSTPQSSSGIASNKAWLCVYALHASVYMCLYVYVGTCVYAHFFGLCSASGARLTNLCSLKFQAFIQVLFQDTYKDTHTHLHTHTQAHKRAHTQTCAHTETWTHLCTQRVQVVRHFGQVRPQGLVVFQGLLKRRLKSREVNYITCVCVCVCVLNTYCKQRSTMHNE